MTPRPNDDESDNGGDDLTDSEFDDEDDDDDGDSDDDDDDDDDGDTSSIDDPDESELTEHEILFETVDGAGSPVRSPRKIIPVSTLMTSPSRSSTAASLLPALNPVAPPLPPPQLQSAPVIRAEEKDNVGTMAPPTGRGGSSSTAASSSSSEEADHVQDEQEDDDEEEEESVSSSSSSEEDDNNSISTSSTVRSPLRTRTNHNSGKSIVDGIAATLFNLVNHYHNEELTSREFSTYRRSTIFGGGKRISGDIGDFGSDIPDSDNNKALKEILEFSKKETRNVQRWKSYILITIGTFSITIIILSFTMLQANQQSTQKAKQSFDKISYRLQNNYQSNMNSLYETTMALSHSITSDAVISHKTFPLVTNPSFEYYANDARTKASYEVIFYAPYVNRQFMDRKKYINFTQHAYRWPLQSYQLRNQFAANEQQRKLQTIPPPPKVIYEFTMFQSNMSLSTWDPSIDDNVFVPTLYVSPPPPLPISYPYMNVNLYNDTKFRSVGEASARFNGIAFSSVSVMTTESMITLIGNNYSQDDVLTTTSAYEETSCIIAMPIYKTLNGFEINTKRKNLIGGFIYAIMKWDHYLSLSSFTDVVDGIDVVLYNTCGQTLTYRFMDNHIKFIGVGDLHSSQFNSYVRWVNITSNMTNPNDDQVPSESLDGHCLYYAGIYPSSVFVASYQANVPKVLCGTIVGTFALLLLVFLWYDRLVQVRNDKLVGAAVRSTAIVSSLFPSNVRDRLLAEKEEKEDAHDQQQKKTNKFTNLRAFLAKERGNAEESEVSDDGDSKNSDPFDITDIYKSKPIADLFPETTILFGDIVGFTAWSSVREPTQVFTLLETIYHAFDDIARRRRVFKVETVGDCYVAVCGLPDPRRDHAITMCRFARDCMFRMWGLVKKLETTLGPDTSELTMRMGLHSGPVTAGVLRGERSRFQLFGDTVNTAARMEHNGVKSKIQLSSETAELLMEAGKASWVTLREDKINAKGKGELQTYWLVLGDAHRDSSATSGDRVKRAIMPVAVPNQSEDESQNSAEFLPEAPKPAPNDKVTRLIGWNVEVLLRLLKQIIARRSASERIAPVDVSTLHEKLVQGSGEGMVMDEVREIIELPQFDARASKNLQDTESIALDPKVFQQLEDFLLTIGWGYRDNPFHNFEHASHVTMSVVKLLSRIIAPSDHYSEGVAHNKDDASSLHDHTYGITSDPLTQFSCVLSALIHDLDHPGVPNAQLVKEGDPLAKHYKNKSVAEQNSVDIAWMLLTQPKYNDLRSAIYQTESEMKRFRQLVVNVVLATDIVDKELKALRNSRWEKAFSIEEENKLENPHDQINRKATIVLEHLIQASDVAHTMQHWHIYRKWNERFFMECYQAYKLGRAEADPSINWYQGEIGFFDFYIIPLAKKLKNCGVFGVSSDEYLNYALKNRKEWEDRGQQIVGEMLEKVKLLWPEEPQVKHTFFRRNSAR